MVLNNSILNVLMTTHKPFKCPDMVISGSEVQLSLGFQVP